MKLIKASGTLSLVALAIIASPLAMAQVSNWSGWYLGANLGRTGATIDDGRITSGLNGQGLTASSISDRDRDNGYKIYGGYQFDRNFALEGGYFDLGKFGFTANTVPTGTLNGNIRLRGVNLDLVGTVPVSERFSVFGRIGANYAEATDDFTGTGAVGVRDPNPSKRDTNLKLGLGLQYAFSERLAMRLEAERYRVNDAIGNVGDVDLISVGLIYRFGARSAAPVASAAPEPMREVVATEPPPQPVMEPAPAPRFEKVTLSATELFGFDSDTLQMPQPKLDEIATALSRNQGLIDVNIIGYTDHIGSAKYNQKLSQRRAVAVKDYLSSKGVDPARMQTKGMGEANPVVVCTEKMRAALIECLAPNRRVEVEDITIERRVP